MTRVMKLKENNSPLVSNNLRRFIQFLSQKKRTAIARMVKQLSYDQKYPAQSLSLFFFGWFGAALLQSRGN